MPNDNHKQESKPAKMSKKSSVSSRRAWDILRLALLWARKGGLFRNRLVMNLNVLQKGIRKLRHSSAGQRGALAYGDREFSFDDTPIIHVKMHRPSSLRFKMPQIPCIKPQVDFDYDFDFDDREYGYGPYGMDDQVKRVSFLKEAEDGDYYEEEKEEDVNGECDEGIDLKAEEFIARFYQQMKMQRQISYLQYNDTPSRDAK